MSLTPEEKRFYLGLAVFGTFAGSGLFVVFEHSFWGWAFIIVGLIGLGYSVLENFGAPMPTRSTRLWALALILTWALMGFDLYDRHHGYNPAQGWKPVPIETLSATFNVTYKNETVELDSRRFVNVSFEDATLVYRGKGPVVFDNVHFIMRGGKLGTRLNSNNPVVNAALGIEGALLNAAGCPFGATTDSPDSRK
jgi:hypothetical protein